MTATLTVRNVDPEIIGRLKDRARRNGRSLEAELRLLLTNAANRLTAKQAIDLADNIAAETPDGAVQTDSTLLLRPAGITESDITDNVADEADSGDWEFYRDTEDLWRWRRLDGEGRITGVSAAGYDSRDDCVENALLTGYKK